MSMEFNNERQNTSILCRPFPLWLLSSHLYSHHGPIDHNLVLIPKKFKRTFGSTIGQHTISLHFSEWEITLTLVNVMNFQFCKGVGFWNTSLIVLLTQLVWTKKAGQSSTLRSELKVRSHTTTPAMPSNSTQRRRPALTSLFAFRFRDKRLLI